MVWEVRRLERQRRLVVGSTGGRQSHCRRTLRVRTPIILRELSSWLGHGRGAPLQEVLPPVSELRFRVCWGTLRQGFARPRRREACRRLYPCGTSIAACLGPVRASMGPSVCQGLRTMDGFPWFLDATLSGTNPEPSADAGEAPGLGHASACSLGTLGGVDSSPRVEISSSGVGRSRYWFWWHRRRFRLIPPLL